MTKTRPINLALWTIRFPVTAITSIAHRITGVLLFVLFPWFLWFTGQLFISYERFDHFWRMFQYPENKIFMWLFLTSLAFHIFAGIRHFLMDIHIADTLKGGRLGAQLVLLLGILSGFWLWSVIW